jgi:PIN domain nuclease of toxin-antitoxin system
MRVLLDTHLLLWAVAKSRRLPKQARRILESRANEIYFSAASIWEIAIKLGLRRRDFDIDLERLRPALAEMDFQELPVTAAHAAGVVALAPIHKDPFDRLLVAQSLAQAARLMTTDPVLAHYGSAVLLLE